MIFRGGIAGRAALTGDHNSAAPRYGKGRLARRRAAPGRVPRRPALTLDRICERMALTKGAFYHHFGSVPKFRMALLDWYEQRRTGAVIEAVEAAGSLGPRDRLLRLLDGALKDTDDAAGPDLEVAIRAWANQDPQAAEMQERVDARRVGYPARAAGRARHRRPAAHRYRRLRDHDRRGGPGTAFRRTSRGRPSTARSARAWSADVAGRSVALHVGCARRAPEEGGEPVAGAGRIRHGNRRREQRVAAGAGDQHRGYRQQAGGQGARDRLALPAGLGYVPPVDGDL
jgi:AcrR family transcriptional regulator